MSLDLVEPGTLEKPGPIGRTLRLALGVFCLYGLIEIVRIAPAFVTDPIGFLPGLSLMLLVALCIFNYVVNIGFHATGIDFRFSSVSWLLPYWRWLATSLQTRRAPRY